MPETASCNNENVAFKKKLEGATLLGRWGRLFIAIAILWVLMAYVAPWGRQTAVLRPIMDMVDERGIKVTSYYYTDSEDFAEAEFNVTQSLRFPPTGPAKSKE